MSIHFRSRIANNNGKPQLAIEGSSGFCCSLNLVTPKSRCIGGEWYAGAVDRTPCSEPTGCVGGPALLNNGACCYWKNNNGNYIQICETTEDGAECFFKNEGLSENLYSQFYAGRIPESEGGDIIGNGVKIYDSNFSDGCIPDDSSGCAKIENIIGNCCRKIGTTVDCSLVPKQECLDGVWVPPKNGVLKSCVNSPCLDILFSQTRTPPVMLQSEKNSTTESFKKLPNPGEYYQGGIYVGVFEENKSLVYGNKNTGNPHEYIARGNGTKTSWILIADTSDFIFNNFNTESETIKELYESYHDGHINTENIKDTTLYHAINLYKNNGFNDWYLPSQDELALYFKNIKPDTIVYGNNNLLPTKYMSSSPFSFKSTQSINGKYFVYIQSAIAKEYGKVSLLERKQGTANIRLFRKIYLVS